MRAKAFAMTALVAALAAVAIHPSPARALTPVTLTIVASPSSVYVEDTITITATVTPSPGACSILLAGQNLTLNAANGTASTTSIRHSPTTGMQFDGIFLGCGDYGSTSWVYSNWVEVKQRTTAITLTSPSSVGRGDPFSVSVAFSPAPPSGTVRIREVGATGIGGILHTVIGSHAVSGSSPITVELPSMLPGSYQLQAEFLNSDEYADTTTGPKSLTVTDRPTTTTITVGPDPSLWGQAITVNIQVSPVPDDGGGVELLLDGLHAAWPTMNWSNGRGTATLTPNLPGDHTVTARFGGSAYPISRYGASEDSESQTVSSTPVDQDPPVGTVEVNNGASLVTDGGVTLTFTVSDASPVQKLEVSNDGSTWESIGVIPDKYWSLGAAGGSNAEGTRTVYARWTDQWNNVGTASDSFTFDWTGPTGVVIIDGSGNYTFDTTVDIAVGATDAGSGVSKVAASNDGLTWTERSYTPSYQWAVTPGDGVKTVHVKWRDGNGHWSSESTDTIILDTTAPIGSVSIAAGAAYTASTSVTVATVATDAVAGMSQVAISNDGSTWTTRTYGASQPWTLPAGNGTKTVYVKWKDAAGNWSGMLSDTIVLDTVAPTATTPGKAFVSGASLSSSSTPTKFSWSGADVTSGIARYEAALSTDAGAYTTLSTSLTSSSLTRNLVAGHTYRLRVRAVDKAGNVGAWVYGSTFTVSAYQENSSRISYSGSWSRPASTSYWGGYEKYATAAGAKATFTFTGRGFAWVGCLGPTRGSAKVYVNGVLAKTVSLSSSTAACKRVVLSLSWSTSGSRQIRIVVSGTSGHPRVGVDALVIAT